MNIIQKLKYDAEFKTDLLLGFFIASLILANLLGSKITTILGVRVSVGIFFVPVLFLVTDIITEVHGKSRAKNFFYISISVLLFALAMMYLCIIMPAHEKWLNQEAYEMIFKGSISSQYKQIGNAVAVKVAEAIGKEIINALDGKTKISNPQIQKNLSEFSNQVQATKIF